MGRIHRTKMTCLGLGCICAAACLSMAPRGFTMEVQSTWATLKQYRYAHRGLHHQPQAARMYPKSDTNCYTDEEILIRDDALRNFQGELICENTKEAFRAAIDHGFGVELDIRLSADGHLVVAHDSDLYRLTGTHLIVEENSLEDIQGQGLLGTQQHVPLFKDVLDLFEAAQLPIICEIKPCDNVDEICMACAELLQSYTLPYCIESFDPRCVKYFKDNHREVVRGQLWQNYLNPQAKGPKNPGLRLMLTCLNTNFLTKPDFIAARFTDKNLLPALISCDVLAAKKVSWTLTCEQDLRKAEMSGAIAIFEGFIPESRPGQYR